MLKPTIVLHIKHMHRRWFFGVHDMNNDRSDSEDEGGQSGGGDDAIGAIVFTHPEIINRLQQSLGSESSGVPSTQKVSTGRGRPTGTYKKPNHITQENWNNLTTEEKAQLVSKERQKKKSTLAGRCSKGKAAVVAASTQLIAGFLVQPTQEDVAAIASTQVLP
jgi:hypothetical protein